jgi:hypothetical protein
MHGPIGHNPSMIIAAMADRIADGITGEAGPAAEATS